MRLLSALALRALLSARLRRAALGGLRPLLSAGASQALLSALG